MTLDELNALDRDRFAAALDGVFEHSPWIAERTHADGPFASVEALHGALTATMMRAARNDQLMLLRAHPELAGKAAIAGDLTAASLHEQAASGLRACTPEEFERMQALNRRYNERFGFPFILAVRKLDRRQILEEFARRVERDRETEFAECLTQVAQIARLRLDAMFGC